MFHNDFLDLIASDIVVKNDNTPVQKTIMLNTDTPC